MKLHEFQGKNLLRRAGLPVPKGEVVFAEGEAQKALAAIGLKAGVAKAQAFTGGRGKAGGIKMFASPDEAQALAGRLLAMTLVTRQTGPAGEPVRAVLLEEAGHIKRELYLAMTLDRAKSSLVFMVSPEGGMDIEEIAEKSPGKILKLYPEWGREPGDELCARGAAFLGLDGSLAGEFASVLRGIHKVYLERDCSLLEINPLVVTDAGRLSILDCKITIDENALFRQKDLGDPDAGKDPAEVEASRYGLSYVKLDGNIGCMVNGAGLAMATMDIIKHYGGEPANFLDVGGSASEEAVAKAFEIICADKNVKAILVNIFGGIMQCDRIARGILGAVRTIGLSVPLVVRLEGTNVEEGKRIIAGSGLDIINGDTLDDAARKAAQTVKERG